MARKLPRFFHGTEADQLLTAAADNPRDYLILQCGFLLGLRVSEICKLEVPHIDLHRRLCFVREGKGEKDRVVPIHEKLVGALKDWIGDRQSGHVFASPRGIRGKLSERAVQKMIKRLAHRAGLANAKEPRAITPHKCRHHFATSLLRKGADIVAIKELLGHQSLNTTMVYLHSDPEHLREAVEKL
jgi:integrase/recombinase XerD